MKVNTINNPALTIKGENEFKDIYEPRNTLEKKFL